MPAPLIGLTTRNLSAPASDFPMIASPKSYTSSLMKAGAIPILVPVNLEEKFNHDLFARLDGIIFTGGGDIEPVRFNGTNHEKVYGLDLERDQSEIEMFKAIQKIELPFMGICRGLQLINVALGGSLYTHISDQLPDALEHDCFPARPPDYLAHPVEIKSNSQLAHILGTNNTEVNSLHHQGIDQVSSEVTPVAWSPDGLVEAIQVADNAFGIAVQWHPEWLPDDRCSLAFFSSFVQTARIHQSKRQSFRTQTQAAA